MTVGKESPVRAGHMQKETMKNRNTTEKILQKHGAKAGFSLLELLLCIMIIGLMSVMLVTGVQLALEAYTRVVDQANARVVLSTTMTMLRTDLSDARDVKTDTGKLKYEDRVTGASCTLYVDEDTADLYIETKYGTESSEDKLFISETGSTKNLHVTCDEITYDKDNGTVMFAGLCVTKDGRVIAASDYTVRIAQ